jgi:hypothetical protein
MSNIHNENREAELALALARGGTGHRLGQRLRSRRANIPAMAYPHAARHNRYNRQNPRSWVPKTCREAPRGAEKGCMGTGHEPHDTRLDARDVRRGSQSSWLLHQGRPDEGIGLRQGQSEGKSRRTKPAPTKEADQPLVGRKRLHPPINTFLIARI